MPESPASVTVVIPCYEQKRFLPRAIESAVAQTRAPDEIIVVDDGSSETLADVTSRFAGVKLIEQANRGLAGARNTGLRACSSEKVVFLDSDDRLLSSAVAAGLECFREHPDAAFVYGGFRAVRGRSRAKTFTAVHSHRDLVRCNWIGCPATVMFDRAKLLTVGGFDENLAMCEDWDAYLRLSRRFHFAAHPRIVADYVRHGANASNDVRELRRWIEVVRAREWHRGLSAADQRAWHEGADLWRATFEENARPPSLAKRLAQRAVRLLSRTAPGLTS